MKNSRVILPVFIVIIIMVFIALNHGTSSPPSSNSSTARPKVDNAPGEIISDQVVITITDSGFVPNKQSVVAGSNIKFVNSSKGVVNPVSDDKVTINAAKDLNPNETYTVTLPNPGTFTYSDTKNPSHKGTITVE